ncbi:MAG: hypothetical protein ACRECX_11545 [Methyloceanibacter sp.]|uniref:hypothetical protein n=1 Tax=Methyloceanibacter sp. TaxID=1965321 RepID=UPI003D6C86D0
MKPILSAVLLASLATVFSFPAHAEKVRCSAIRDSAMCVAEPSCWYDAANNKGCLDGPRPEENACAVHGSESTCNTSSLGCTWSAAGECVTKTE